VRSLRELAPGSYGWGSGKDDPQLRQLLAGDDVVATLRWKEGFAAEGVEAQTADGAWAFDRRGMLTRQVIIDPRGGVPAEYDSAGWEGGGELRTATGGRYGFRPTTVLSTRWAWVGEGDVPLVSFLLERRRIFRRVEIVRLEPAVGANDDVSLLVVLGSWLAILGRRDQGASG